MRHDPRLDELIQQSFTRFAQKTAIIDDAGEIGYGDLRTRVEQCIQALQRLGITPGGRVSHVAEATIDSMVIDLACYVGGFTRVPVNPRAHRMETTDYVQRSRAEIFVNHGATDDELAGIFESCHRLRAAGRFVDGAFEGRTREVERAQRTESDDADAPAGIAFTSGTTGQPKGAVHSARALLASTVNITAALQISERDVPYLPLPLSNIGGHLALAFLLRGATVVLRRSWSPEGFLAAQREHGANLLVCVPTMLRALLPYAAEIPRGAIRRLVYGAAPTPIEDIISIREAFGPVLTQMYGQTEVGIVAALGVEAHDFDPASPPPHLGSTGHAVPGVLIHLVDADGRKLPDDEIGEIVVRAPSALTEYLDDPLASEAVRTADGSIRTGDLGHFDAGGHLHIVGRSKETIITGGYNVYPLEVEIAVRQLAEVADVSVLGIPDEEWGEVVTACVVWASEEKPDPGMVQAVCREHLAGYKVPKRVHTVEDLPRNSSGKVDKQALRALFG